MKIKYDHNRIIALRNQGHSRTYIAREMGCCWGTVYDVTRYIAFIPNENTLKKHNKDLGFIDKMLKLWGWDKKD